MILTGNDPSRPGYRAASHGDFAASTALGPPPLLPLLHPTADRSVLPRLALTHSEPLSDSLPHVVSLQLAEHDVGVRAVAVHLFETLLSYSCHGWEQAQRDELLCDTARGDIQSDTLNIFRSPFVTASPYISCLIPQAYLILPQNTVYSRVTRTPSYWSTTPPLPAPLASLPSMALSASTCLN